MHGLKGAAGSRKISESDPLEGKFGSASERIGELIRNARIDLGLSEAEVASYVGGISTETLKKYESGRKSIPLSHIYALSNCLNISPKTIIQLLNRMSK